MRAAPRILSLLVALVLFAWLLSHAGGFNPDGSPVDPNPPPWYLMVGGMFTFALLVVYAGGYRSGRAAGHGPGDSAEATDAGATAVAADGGGSE